VHEGARYLRQEIAYGQWERSFELPFSIQADKADAHFEHGMLTVMLPKAEEVQAAPDQDQRHQRYGHRGRKSLALTRASR
jgi:HSP20 family molecular chaperone IbpA